MEIDKNGPVLGDQIASKEGFSVILESVSDAVMVQDSTFKIVYVNELAVRLCGYESINSFLNLSYPEMVSRFEIYRSDESVLPIEELPSRKAFTTGKPVTGEILKVKNKETGEITWKSISARPIFAGSKTPLYVVSVFEDVTEKLKVEEEQKFIADASKLFSSSLDLQVTLDNLGRLIVPRFADWYGLELLDENGILRLEAVAHSDPRKIELALQMKTQYPSDPKSTTGPYAVVRSGKTEFIEELTDAMLVAGAQDTRQLEILRKLGFSSFVTVPLKVRDKVIGILSLVNAESKRKFTTSNIHIVEEIGFRAAMAIENSRLYADVIAERGQLYSVFTQLPAAIAVVRGKELRYEIANEPYCDLIGKYREIIGRSVEEVFPDMPAENMHYIRRAGLNGERFTNTEMPVSLDWDNSGKVTPKYINIIYEPLFDSRRRPDGFIVFASDVTAQVLSRKNVEEVADNFRVLTETIPNMVWTARADGTLEYFNQKWFEYTGLTEEQTFKQQDLEVIHPDDYQNMQVAWKGSIATGNPLEIEYRIRRAVDGEYRWHIARALPVYDVNAKIEKWFGTCTDIHDRKALEQELVRAKEAAEQANQAKSNFLANMSHEIRTPLGAILGFSQLLKTTLGPESQGWPYLDTIVRNSRALTQIIDDILDLSKVEAGKLSIDKATINLRDVLKEVSSLFSITTKTKNIYLEVDLSSDFSPIISTDAARLRQILINLIGNAVKFTSTGGVRVLVTHTEENKINFLISDTGIGVDEKYHQELFKPFSQGDSSTTRKFGGTGLGLILSRRLAQALGGDITLVESKLGKGSKFLLEIAGNLTKASENSEPIPEAPIRFSRPENKPDLGGAKILVVEDSIDNQDLIKLILNLANAEVDIANNGQEGVDRALANNYDLILMDIQMPVLDGYKATETLRARGYKKPIVALTAHALLEEKEKCMRVGCTAHLTKPIDQKVFFAVLASALANK
ncbi:MAG: PAS domain S-box protein [Bdellovibrionota bacterium]